MKSKQHRHGHYHGPPRILSQTAWRKAHTCHQITLGYMLVIGLLWCLLNTVQVMRVLSRQDDTSATTTTAVPNLYPTPLHSMDSLIEKKARILDLLLHAGIDSISVTTLQELPTWHQVVQLYGAQPKILGFEDSCFQYSKLIPPHDMALATAGMFNSGTNLLAELLIHNCHIPARMQKYGAENRGIRWQVNWGKHTPPEMRLGHETYHDHKVDNSKLLPVVTIRDPYPWMQSMCRHNYATQWFHSKEHCPNLIVNSHDKQAFVEQDYPNHLEKPQHYTNFTLREKVVGPVRVNYATLTKYHTSLAHFWNDWNTDYSKATFPRLMVRYEDLIFHAQQVTTEICQCAGGELNRGKFQFITDSAKKGTKQHGTEKTNFLQALIKYGNPQFRFEKLDQADLDYAQEVLDPTLMETFGYKHNGQVHDENLEQHVGGERSKQVYRAMIVTEKNEIKHNDMADATTNDKKQPPKAAQEPIHLDDDDKDKVLQKLREGGVPDSVLKDPQVRSKLPSWEQITNLYGESPVIEGMDRCEAFRHNVPALDRHLGAAGMFNTGTNLITMLLKANCIIPERFEHYGPNATKEQYGMRWQVPWGKHTPAQFRLQHHATKAAAIVKEHVLPIVLIRNPYNWMKSTCQHPYTARWPHSQTNCPRLKLDSRQNNPVSVKYANNYKTHHDSLAHLWNDWNLQYYQDATYPRLMIRFEDVIFFQETVTEQVCKCAGGIIRKDRPFQHLIQSAKDGPGHGNDRTGMVDAWIKYGKPTRSGFSQADQEAAKEYLDKTLMEQFGYHHAPSK